MRRRTKAATAKGTRTSETASGSAVPAATALSVAKPNVVSTAGAGAWNRATGEPAKSWADLSGPAGSAARLKTEPRPETEPGLETEPKSKKQLKREEQDRQVEEVLKKDEERRRRLKEGADKQQSARN